jgi:hypothetical protein
MPASGSWGLAAAGLILSIAACSGQAAVPSLEASPGAVPTATAAATPAPRPTAPPRVPAPAELQGRWQTVIGPNDKPVLTIADFKYTIERLGIGTGAVSVDGDQITFSGSNLCSGAGVYHWEVEGDSLKLTAVGPDACPNRADAVAGRTFTRVG